MAEQAQEETRFDIPHLVQDVSPGYINDPEALDLAFYKTVFKTRDNNILLSRLGNLETDTDEIRERQKIFRAILENPEVARQLASLSDPRDVPSSYHSLDYYLRNGTSFYDMLRNAIGCLDQFEESCSERLTTVCDSLEGMVSLKEKEETLIPLIAEEARQCHKYVGTIVFEYDGGRFEPLKVQATEGFGFMRYPFSKEENEFYSGTPTCIADDITEHIKGASKALKSFWGVKTVRLVVDYRYGPQGLEINVGINRKKTELEEHVDKSVRDKAETVLDAFRKPRYGEMIPDLPSSSKNPLVRYYANLKEKRKQRIRRRELKKEAEMREKYVENLTWRRKEGMLASLEVAAQEMSGKIASENSQEHFTKEGIESLLGAKKESLDVYRNARAAFGRFLTEFKDYLQVAETFIRYRDAGFPVTLPTIVSADRREIDIENLYQMRLVMGDYDKTVVPNNVSCNGKPTVVTGPNAGGKSLYLEAVDDGLLWTQLGGPILAESATVSPKDALFVHFIKEGDAKMGVSTFQNALRRFTEMFSKVPKYSNPHIIADEVGVGTDPESAYGVSRRVARGLAGISSIASSYFVTTFKDVAEMARDEFGANTVRFRDFHMEPGIGDAEGMKLADQEGFTDEFIDRVIAEVIGG
ncbi:MAG: hypothetical protein ABIE94_00020 [archaeon]